jgi:phosphopantothenoylcysteine decarboxylase/phosphopantothenate--cysteine ligase
VANDVSAPNAGFEVDTNQVILLYSSGSWEETPLLDKRELAGLILDRVAAFSTTAAPEQRENCR